MGGSLDTCQDTLTEAKLPIWSFPTDRWVDRCLSGCLTPCQKLFEWDASEIPLNSKRLKVKVVWLGTTKVHHAGVWTNWAMPKPVRKQSQRRAAQPNRARDPHLESSALLEIHFQRACLRRGCKQKRPGDTGQSDAYCARHGGFEMVASQNREPPFHCFKGSPKGNRSSLEVDLEVPYFEKHNRINSSQHSSENLKRIKSGTLEI